MSGYYKHYAESHDGDVGECYYDVRDGLVVRQVSVFDGVYYWATLQNCYDEQYDFTEKPEFDESDVDSQSIPPEVFDAVWSAAIAQPARP